MAVVEVGTWNVRAGYIGDVVPTYSLRSMGGFPITSLGGSLASCTAREVEPMWNLRALETFPEGHIDALRHIRNNLLQCGEEEPLMLVVPELWHERLDVMEQLCRLILESHVAPALYFCRPSVAWTLSQGRSSALVTDFGYSHVTSAAVLDGQTLRHTVESIPVGSAAVLAQYKEMLQPVLQPALTSCFPHLDGCGREVLGREISSEIMERVGFVASHAVPVTQPPAVPEYRAPDGMPISLTPEQRCQPFEVFFGRLNAADVIARTKVRLDPEWQASTVPHLIVGGVPSGVPGVLPRLIEELKDRDSAYRRYEEDNGLQIAKRRDGAWTGASLAGSSSSFFPLWITQGEWMEDGPSVLHRKLFY